MEELKYLGLVLGSISGLIMAATFFAAHQGKPYFFQDMRKEMIYLHLPVNLVVFLFGLVGLIRLAPLAPVAVAISGVGTVFSIFMWWRNRLRFRGQDNR